MDSNLWLFLVIWRSQVVILGDFNIHVEKATKPVAGDLLDLLASVDCVQKIQLEPTHRDGRAIDLVITKSDQTLNSLKINPPDTIFAYQLITAWLAGICHFINICQLHSIERIEAGRKSTEFSCSSTKFQTALWRQPTSISRHFLKSTTISCSHWLISLHQFGGLPWDVSDSQPGWTMNANNSDDIHAMLVCRY